MAAPPVDTPSDAAAKRLAKPLSTADRPTPNKPTESTHHGRGAWVFWIVVLALGGAGWHYRAELEPYVAPITNQFSPAKPTRPPQRAVTVGTAKVRQRDVNFYLNGLGTVTAFKTVTVRSRVEGELLRVAVQEGQPVTEGDLLAEVDPRLWQAQLEQAEGQFARDQAALKSAQLTLDRYQQLLATKIVTAQQIDEQLSLVQQAEAAIKTDQALISNAKLQLDYCRITAPISGRIGLRLVDSGNIVRANDPTGIAVITQLQPISLVFTIPQDDISRVQRRVRDDSRLSVEAFDRDFRNRLAVGKLVAIDNQVDPTTGTVRLKAVFDNEDETLFPNQFVNARLLVETEKNATVAPTAAVQRGPSSMFVYVVQDDETVALREVEVGANEGTDTVILDGLKPDEIVVTDGLDKLLPGAKVVTKAKKKPEEGAVGSSKPGEKTPAETKPDTSSAVTSQPAPSEAKAP
ncbi:MAG: MdtA/MuxA family multidrug efflux RND transporter periplasmic adaptor subunit [Planctomycetaceae bacterium]|nr:MdtA/MuxA family multidrug efflux RND transporter periplasmic adaptor subunit [Planctomycetaceae bacterium]